MGASRQSATQTLAQLAVGAVGVAVSGYTGYRTLTDGSTSKASAPIQAPSSGASEMASSAVGGAAGAAEGESSEEGGRLVIVCLAVGAAGAAGYLLWRRRWKKYDRKDRGLDDIVSYSSRMIAASRAVESERPDAIFVDPLAKVFAGEEALERSRARMAKAPGVNRIAVRTKYFDDALLAAFKAGAPGALRPRQVVLLGAGMDSRAWRLPLPGGVRWFEVDNKDVLEVKSKLIAEHANVKYLASSYTAVGADLCDPGWSDTLTAAGLDTTKPIVWLLEGLTMYLDDWENTKVVEGISRLSPKGSVLLVSLVNRKSLERAQAATESELMSTWRWGTDDPAGFYGALGWTVARINQPGDPEASYGRYGAPKGAIDDHSEGKVMYIQADNNLGKSLGIGMDIGERGAAPRGQVGPSLRSAADAGATEGGREITDKNKAAVHAAAAGFFRGAGL